MTSDSDIEQFVENHYNPDIATPEEYMNSTQWGSGVRQQVAYRKSQSLYEDYQRARGVTDEEIQEERERLEAQEQSDIAETQEEFERQQREQQEEYEGDSIIERAGKLIRDIIRGVFG